MDTKLKAILAASGALVVAATAAIAVKELTADSELECRIPNCWVLHDGGWKDDAVVDCRVGGPVEKGPGAGDPSPQWRGCNVVRKELVPYVVGTKCLPARCQVMAGEDAEALR